jgi:cyclopropane-fatty-acyl-phospholipid synthase
MTPFFAGLARRRLFAALEAAPSGRLHLTTPEGDRHTFGTSGPEADLHIRDWSILPAMERRGDVALGETYIAGLWHTSSIERLVAYALRNFDRLGRYAHASPLRRLRYRLAERLLRNNSIRGASRNIRAHYDVGNEFYQLWLDRSMTYSSALFAEGDDLESAQSRKYDRILSRLGGGDSVLEIGCGWGGFAERASAIGRRVTGLTISPSQKAYADALLDGRADIRLQDYRHVGGRFDNIVSIEMIEAVGERHWPAYFRVLKERLAEGGHAVIQAITISDAEFSTYRSGTDFIRQHVFPGGMLPCQAVLAREASRAGLVTRDCFAFGQHYARTCRTWAARLDAQADRIKAQGFSEEFLRGWRFYLEICAAAFVVGRTDVVQLELVHAG